MAAALQFVSLKKKLQNVSGRQNPVLFQTCLRLAKRVVDLQRGKFRPSAKQMDRMPGGKTLVNGEIRRRVEIYRL